MKTFILHLLLSFLTIFLIKNDAPNIERPSYYAAMKGDDLSQVENQLALISKDTANESRAFEGALLMKKAGLIKGPFKKLKLFKKGHSLLEDVLKLNTDNPELRFLRLMIQEKAPAIVNYRDKLEEDSKFIQSEFKNIPAELQKIIIDYSKTSKILKPESFKT